MLKDCFPFLVKRGADAELLGRLVDLVAILGSFACRAYQCSTDSGYSTGDRYRPRRNAFYKTAAECRAAFLPCRFACLAGLTGQLFS